MVRRFCRALSLSFGRTADVVSLDVLCIISVAYCVCYTDVLQPSSSISVIIASDGSRRLFQRLPPTLYNLPRHPRTRAHERLRSGRRWRSPCGSRRCIYAHGCVCVCVINATAAAPGWGCGFYRICILANATSDERLSFIQNRLRPLPAAMSVRTLGWIRCASGLPGAVGVRAD